MYPIGSGAINSQRRSSDQNSSLLDQYCKSAACAGVNDWHQATGRCSKTVWMTMLVIAMAITAWQTIEILMDYIHGENRFQSVVTSESYRNLSFPNMIICNFNRVNGTQVAESKLDPKIFTLAFCTFPIIYQIPLYDMYRIGDMEVTQQEHFRAWNDYKGDGPEPDPVDLLMKFGHSCEKTIVRMMLGPEFVNPCQMAKPIVTNFGRCYSFDLSSRSQIMPGSSMGLNMIINPALNDYMNNATFCNFIEMGVVLQISYSTEPWLMEPLAVSPGTHAFVTLSIINQRFVAGRYPIFDLPCRKNAKLNILTGDYTKRMCYHDCIIFASTKRCNCTPSLPNLKQFSRRCAVEETWECFVDTINDENKAKILHEDLDYKNCISQCQEPCEGFRQVSAAVTTTQFLIENSMESFKSMFRRVHSLKYRSCPEENMEQCLKNFIIVDIYFPTLTATTITTSEAQPLFTFIGTIGGQLGLWTGMCIVTLVQAIYYLLLCCCRPKTNNRPPIQLPRPDVHPYWRQYYT